MNSVLQETTFSFTIFNRSVMLDRAENLLHDHYGGKDYWNVSILQLASLNFLFSFDKNSVTSMCFCFALVLFS